MPSGVTEKHNGYGHTEQKSATGQTDSTDRRPSQGFEIEISIKNIKN
jgi:hypothetical protein